MAVISPAIGVQGGSHTAQSFRQLISALIGQDVETFTNSIGALSPGHGVVRQDHLAVSEKSGTPDMSVDVAAGLALITGDQSLAQGVYAFANDAVVNLAIATADGSNPRNDLIVAQIRDDDEDGGGNNDARLAVVTGTAAASPSDPTVPDGALVLARVNVAAADTSITDAEIDDLRTYVRSAVSPTFGIYDYDGTAIANATSTPITMEEIHDPQGWLSGGNVVPDVPGWYIVTATCIWPTTTTNRFLAAVRKNGSDLATGISNIEGPTTGNPTNNLTVTVSMNGTSDALDMRLLHGVGSNQTPTVRMDVRYLGP